MTIPEILSALEAGGRPHSTRQLYRRLRKLNIEPTGIRQIPQIYPDDTALKILKALGWSNSDETFKVPQYTERDARPLKKKKIRLLTVGELKRAKRKGGRK